MNMTRDQAVAEMTAPAQAREALCQVWDLSAKPGQTRVHQIERSQYSLHSNIKTEGARVPLRHAVFFLKSRTFIVFDPDGNRLELDQDPTEGFDVSKFNLPPHMTVANLGELSLDALMARVRRLPGGHTITRTMGRERIQDFIMAGGLKEPVREVSGLDLVGVPVKRLKPGQTLADVVAEHQEAQAEAEEGVEIDDDDPDAPPGSRTDDGDTDFANALLGEKQIPGVKKERRPAAPDELPA